MKLLSFSLYVQKSYVFYSTRKARVMVKLQFGVWGHELELRRKHIHLLLRQDLWTESMTWVSMLWFKTTQLKTPQKSLSKCWQKFLQSVPFFRLIVYCFEDPKAGVHLMMLSIVFWLWQQPGSRDFSESLSSIFNFKKPKFLLSC